MDQFRHLFPHDTGTSERYLYPRKIAPSEFKTPPRDRVPHSRALVEQINEANEEFASNVADSSLKEKPKGIALDFQSDPAFKLQLKSLEREQSGIELRSSRIDDRGIMHATVFVPEGKLGIFVRKFEAYATTDSKKGKPKNNDLVASINQIRLAALESFWTESGKFPTEKDRKQWWEVWLSEMSGSEDEEAVNAFRDHAQAIGIRVSERVLRFPDRRVVLAFASVNDFLALQNIFDTLAELRLAKTLAGEFLEVTPRDQADFIKEALSRITPPPTDSPSVCHLDTGVNRGHPLLKMALAEEHLLAVDPTWKASDGDPQQHGTEMACLALYGCLTNLLMGSDSVSLRHRLESVKIVPDHGSNDPDLYGEVTAQSVYRIEIAAPEHKRRAFALTITADSRDEGLPSSWSAALDQLCSGGEESRRPTRLVFVSAGNTPLAGRHEYPNHCHLNGVEDPAQAWNAVTVGAFTEKTLIRTADYQDWTPVAKTGQLSPASRTSLVWKDRTWAVKPDIVMEGGNLAIDPTTGNADYVDDLMLLTTRTSTTGAMLTTTGDTSASTALAARYAAIIWSRYPDLTPESVRGLLVHSARWTNAMMAEFPSDLRRDVENRLRVFGFGVPSLDLAIWSLRSNATLVIEDTLQPFEEVTDSSGQRRVKPKDMRLHQLPWPKQVLEKLGEEVVHLRVTLSYFIEPSPGRRGWTRKHRYQSHGLRYDIKRPTDLDDREFLKRITKSAWGESEDSVSSSADERSWAIGPTLRCKGSIHSDVWTGTAAQLASSGTIAVYPVTGWWRERPNLNRWDRSARYTLIVSLETESAEVDLYTPIAASIGISTTT